MADGEEPESRTRGLSWRKTRWVAGTLIGAAALYAGTAVSVLGAWWFVFGTTSPGDQEKYAELQAKNVENFVESYRLMEDRTPESLVELCEGDDPLVRDCSRLRDPWDRPLVYETRGSDVHVWSRGPDGAAHTEDDIGRE